MKKKLLSILAALMLVLVACNGNTDNNGTNESEGDDGNVEQTRYEDDDRDMNDRDDNMNDDRNRENNMNNDPERDNNMNDGRDNRDNMDEYKNNDDRKRKADRNEYQLADQAADKITDDVDNIDRAYVMKTGNNAYVAAQLNNKNADNNNDMNNDKGNDQGSEVTDEVKQEVSDAVESVDPDIDNVYVTTNPDFFDLTGDYADKAEDGKPVKGMFDEMGNMIDRIFPQGGQNR